MGASPRILLTGTFCALNKGDAAMQLSAARALPPGSEITILTPHANIDRATYDRYRVVQSSRRRPVIAFTRLLRAALWRGIVYLGIDAQILLRGEELQAYRQADLVIDLSGDTITEDYGVPCLVSHLVPVWLAVLLKRPVMLCAQTIGPFRWARPLARSAIARAALVTAREDQSYAELCAMGLQGVELHRTNDAAFLLEPVPAPRVDAILESEGIRVTDAPFFGISLSGLHGLRGGVARNRLVELFAAVADDFIEANGAAVLFLAHVTGPGARRDDREMLRDVVSRMQHRSQTHVVAGDYRPEELKGLIGRCAAFMGMRMHANIAALGMNVPTLAVAYSRKTHGIMAAAGQPHWVCALQDVDRRTLGRMLNDLWVSRDAVREELEACQAKLRARSVDNFRLVEMLLARVDGAATTPR